MQAVLSDLGHGKFMRLAASIVIGVCILGVSAAVAFRPCSNRAASVHSTPAISKQPSSSTIQRRYCAGMLRRRAISKAPLFGMETVPVAGELAAKWRAVEAISIVNNRCWRAAARKKPVPLPHKKLLISLLKAPAARAAPALASLTGRLILLSRPPAMRCNGAWRPLEPSVRNSAKPSR